MVLSGGIGKRLWPISTAERPKQFASLISEGPLFALALGRLTGLTGAAAPVVVTGADQLDHVERAVASAAVHPELVIVEPAGRNTAPAVLAAALALPRQEVLVILPSDHLIADEEGFRRAVASAARHAEEGALVTFGIEPTRAETGYGYIERGDPVDGGNRVIRFKEKPDTEEAERLASDGSHLWNSGMFAVRGEDLLAEAERHCPEVLAAVRAAMRGPKEGLLQLGEEFAEVEKISLDHAVMERTERGVVIPIDVGWDDLGSFEVLWSVSPKDGAGNVAQGDVVLSDVTDSYVRSASRLLVVSGVSDMVVVETEDAVLVIPRRRSQEVKEIADLVDRA